MSKKKSLKKPEQGLTQFFGANAASSAVRASGFDIHEEIETIIGWARDADPKVSLPALKHLRSVLKEIAVADGMFGTVQETRKTEEGNNSVQQTVSTHALLSNLREDNEKQATEFFQKKTHEVHLPLEEQHPSPDPEVFFDGSSDSNPSSPGGGPDANPGSGCRASFSDPEDV